MSGPEKRTRNGKTRWYARHYDPSGTRHTKVFDTKGEADRWLTGVGMSMITGSYVDPNRSKVTVGELADQWLEAKLDLAPKTRERYAGIIGTHIRPAWGESPTQRRTPCRRSALARSARSRAGQRPQDAPSALDGLGLRRPRWPTGDEPRSRGQPAARPASRATLPDTRAAGGPGRRLPPSHTGCWCASWASPASGLVRPPRSESAVSISCAGGCWWLSA